MDSNPVLELLARDESPPFRSFQHAATIVDGYPQHLSNLVEKEVKDDLLKQTAEPLKGILSGSEHHDLLCTSLQFCSTTHHRWKLLKAVIVCDQAIELLTVSHRGHCILLQWVSAFNDHGLDTTTLETWTQKLVTLVESCPDSHQILTCLARWRKIEKLKNATHTALEDEEEKLRISSKTNILVPLTKGSTNDDPIMQLFSEFSLPAPRSNRVYNYNLEVLRGRETLSILKEILKSFPCKTCQYSLQHDTTLPQIRQALDYDCENNLLDDTLFSPRNGIGDWQVVLSSRAYRDLQTFEGDSRIMETLRSALAELAAGKAKSKILDFRSQAPIIPLRATKWRSDTFFLWQVDIAVGPKPEMEQQVTKVWTVGSRQKLQSMLAEIKKYQQSLPDTHVARCCDDSLNLQGQMLPKIYDQMGNIRKPRPEAEFDIRQVDQDFIDTFNKSFTVTKALLQSIFRHDLTAEFPFDLSRKEMEIIRHFKCPTLTLGRSGTGKTTCLVFKMIAKYVACSKASPPRTVKQILLTRSERLADRLRAYSGKLVSTLSQQAIVPKVQSKSEVVDHPTLFDLDYNEYPLVCTYDHFLILVANTLDTLDRKAPYGTSNTTTQLKLVDFKVFRNRYWPRFPHDLTNGLSPYLVFTDIMGVIKGSIDTCNTLNSLKKWEYEALGTRRAPNVTSDYDRGKVFRLFEIYEKLKREADEWDTIDWVVHLLGQLRNNPNTKSLLATCIEEVYIDEVQDQRCVDIALLLELGNDPLGYHFGGDTAQAISQDSMFRFQDVKNLFYSHFIRQSTAVGQKHRAQPQMFTLNRNYRSHQGILSIASSVMELLWGAFPDTVDKLDPEVGTLVGPVPMLFLDCDANVLIPQEQGASSSPEHELAFGAEQVIVTRDDVGKAQLIHKIGETALVLTILQAKGMEFDDVILWDFFSTASDPSGWRSLQESAERGFSSFDAAKHATLCSDLKHLYVAITRARVRLAIIESSGKAAQPFKELMNSPSSLPLLEVTSVDDPGFSDKIKALQTQRSNDPSRWRVLGDEMMAQFDYSSACLCFVRAKEPLKEKKARACLKESQGEQLEAEGKESKSRIAFEAALADFQDLGLTPDMARLLTKLKPHEDAANLWYEDAKFDQAALLFEKVSNYQRASDSWHLHGKHSKALACLRDGALHNQLVLYLAQNKESLNGQELHQHQLVVKLLLRQQKISQEYRQRAIGLIGSFAEQEAFYLEYDMTENLLDLYSKQHARSKLFDLLVGIGRLKEALDIASSLRFQRNASLDPNGLSKIVSMVWVDRIYSGLLDCSSLAVECNEKPSWQFACRILRTWNRFDSQRQVLSLQDSSVVKAFLSLYVTIHIEEVARASTLDEMPLDLLYHAVKLIKAQQSEPREVVGEAVLLLCGVSPAFDSLSDYTMRDWSPLQKLEQFSPDRKSLPEAAMRWTFNQVSQAILRVHGYTKELFRRKWPVRCNIFLTTGKCKSRNESPACSNFHQHVTSLSCAEFLNDLLRINMLLCELSPLYYRRVMPERTSESFLGARRHWLERLITGLSFVSGFEQDSEVQNKVAGRIRTEDALRGVISGLESNLLYKAREEWSSQASLGYVLEQLDFASHLGNSVKLLLVKRTQGQLRKQHTSIYTTMVRFEELQKHIISGNPVEFSKALKDYLRGDGGVMTLDWSTFRVFHCHTSMFEAIVFYLLLRISRSSIVVPRAWLDLHLSGILNLNGLAHPPHENQLIIYRDDLVQILEAFIELLQWADKALQDGQKFMVGGRTYPYRILQQRNCELLGIILVNLRAIPNLCPANIQKHWKAVVGVFKLATVKAQHLEHLVGNVNELRNRLAESHSKYHGKNPLLILNITDTHPHPFTAFQNSCNLSSKSLTLLRNRFTSTKRSNNETTFGAERAAEYDEKAILCIQRHWRKYGPKIRARRAFADTAIGRTVTRLHGLGSEAGLQIRSLLFSLGNQSFAQLGPLALSVSAVKKRAFRVLDNASSKNSEALGVVLETVGRLDDSLKRHHDRLSDKSLVPFIRAGDNQGLENLLQGELEQMAKEELEVVGLREVLAGIQ